MPQWPLPSVKLAAAHDLVKEQLNLGHIQPSTSPWNTPIFVIKKKSGKWRLLHDLRAVNAQMQLMGPIQRGLPLLSSVPQGWHIIAIDIKDCFFSIPLHPKDSQRFAFTLPSCNHEEPDLRFEWVVLPQGMANSPTMCQMYVGKALAPLRHKYSSIKIIHYMDDVLLAAKLEQTVNEAYKELVKLLAQYGLHIAPEKVQKGDSIEYLGAIIGYDKLKPQKITIRTQDLQTLNDFQKLLGDINWIRGYLHIPNAVLQPLYATLKGDPDLASPRSLTKEARAALLTVEDAIQNATLYRLQTNKPFQLCVLATMRQPTGVLWQDGPLLWIHPHISPGKSLEYYPDAVAALALKGIQQSIQFFGQSPSSLIIPYTKAQLNVLCATLDNWAILCCSFQGDIDNHYPSHPLLHFVKEHPIIFPKVTSPTPIPGAVNIFTDGSKSGMGAYVINDSPPVQHQFAPGNPQWVELQIVIEVFKQCSFPFNLISDSIYVVQALKVLEAVGAISNAHNVSAYFNQLQQLICSRTAPFYPMHIRAHTSLPGPLSQGNACADSATRGQLICLASSLEGAKLFHQNFHVNALTLRRRFSISRADARQIVLQCPHCVTFLHPPTYGVNPRGLKPLVVWQMDVTHIPDFGNLKYVHVSVDTCSGVIHASALSGEKARNVITHCLEAWAAWGAPASLKTDNGPAYTGKQFTSFCSTMGVQLTHGLPYNPQGQGIVERAHRTLKETLQKQKGGIGAEHTPKERLSLALFTINFLNLDIHGRSAADRHVSPQPSVMGYVKWKDVLMGQWNGPDPVLTWARGSVCVFPQDRTEPLWVPERLTRRVLTSTDQQQEILQQSRDEDLHSVTCSGSGAGADGTDDTNAVVGSGTGLANADASS